MEIPSKGEYFLPAALTVVPGKDNECPVLYRILDDFLKAVEQDVVKRLILDRGFLDGERIGVLKKQHGIDTLIPIKKNLDIYKDAEGLMSTAEFVAYESPKDKPEPKKKPEKSQKILKREEKRLKTVEAKKKEPEPEKHIVNRQVASISDFTSFSQ